MQAHSRDLSSYTRSTLHPFASSQVFDPCPIETGEEEDEQVARMRQNAYCTNVVPRAGAWIDLQNGIEFMRQLEEGDEKSTHKTKTIFFLKAVQPAGSKDKPETKDKAVRLIEAFIDEALELYRTQQAQKSDYSRYLYIPVLSGFSAMLANKDEEEKSSAIYKRYKLSEEKQFSSFFHPDKVRAASLKPHLPPLALHAPLIALPHAAPLCSLALLRTPLLAWWTPSSRRRASLALLATLRSSASCSTAPPALER